MLPTTMAVQAADTEATRTRLSRTLRERLLRILHVGILGRVEATLTYRPRFRKADQARSSEIVPTTRASQPSANPLRTIHSLSERSVSQ